MTPTPEEPTPLSPCNNDCDIDSETGFCVGCFRTIDEIMHWPTMTASQRRDVLRAVDVRRASST